MRNEFTAIIEQDGDWFIAYCPEIPGANGQGHTKREAKRNLAGWKPAPQNFLQSVLIV